MERPLFTYHPNAYDLSFEEVEGICDCCGQARALRYRGPFYTRLRPDYLCPLVYRRWQGCGQLRGRVHRLERYRGGIPDPADPPPTIARELLLEICERTRATPPGSNRSG